jgi:hypothetical protein
MVLEKRKQETLAMMVEVMVEEKGETKLMN